MRQQIADWLNVIFGMRNLIAWLCLFIVSILFRMKGYIDGGQFVDFSKNTFMYFAAAHGCEHFMTVAREYVKGQSVLQADNVAVADEPDTEKK